MLLLLRQTTTTTEPQYCITLPNGTRTKTGVTNIIKALQPRRQYTFAEFMDFMAAHWSY